MKSLNTILVVDDEVAILELMRHFLREKASHILTAENGVDALQCLKDNKVDLIISDISMPNMNGIEFLKQLRQKEDNTPFAIMTAYENLREELESLDLDVLIFINKPIKKDKIETIIDAYKKKAN